MGGYPLNAAVIGVGSIGAMHAKTYAEHPMTDLAAVVDLDESAAAAVADEHDAGRIETDVETALAGGDVDLVTVSTPEWHHLEPTRTALESGCHVLLEKPIADTVADAREIGRLADAADTFLTIGYLLRYDPRYAGLKAELDDFGDLLSVHAARISNNWGYYRRGDVSHPVYYLAVHDIDMLRWYTGSEVTEVYARASPGLGDVETPAVLHSTLEFADGTVGTLETNWARHDDTPSPLTQELRVTGTDGYGHLRLEATEDDVATTTEAEGYHHAGAARMGNILRWQVDHVVDSIVEGEAPLVTWEDGLRSLEVAHAIVESTETDAPVAIE